MPGRMFEIVFLLMVLVFEIIIRDHPVNKDKFRIE